MRVCKEDDKDEDFIFVINGGGDLFIEIYYSVTMVLVYLSDGHDAHVFLYQENKSSIGEDSSEKKVSA